MTKREFLEKVIATATDAEVKQYAEEGLAQLDLTNEKRRAKNAAKADANQVFVDQLVGFAGSEAKTASDFLAMFKAAGTVRGEGKEFNVQFVSTLARKAVDQGKLVSTEVKIPKKGTQKGYVLA